MYSSQLAQILAINEIAESMMAFNTNYKDTGLFGVYAVAKVRNRGRCFKFIFFSGCNHNRLNHIFGGKRLAFMVLSFM